MRSDWRLNLSFDDQQRLDTLLYKIQKYQYVYRNSDNPQTTQLWLVMLEMEKELQTILGLAMQPGYGAVTISRPVMRPAMHVEHPMPAAIHQMQIPASHAGARHETLEDLKHELEAHEQHVAEHISLQKPKYRVAHPEVAEKIDEKQRLRAQGLRPEKSDLVKRIEENW